MRIASSAAFFAPCEPIASVPTGTPPGICTIDEQRVEAAERVAVHRHAEHRQERLGCDDARQMSRQAGRRDDHFQAALLGRLHVFRDQFRRPVRRGHFCFVRNIEFIEYLGRRLHRFPIRLRAHQDADERF